MIAVECRKCKKDVPVNCTDEQYIKWKTGQGLIQNVMPNVPANERELLISGICGPCFDILFKEPD